MYRKGNEINAEGTPPLEWAKASVSVPVARLAAALWNGIFLFSRIDNQFTDGVMDTGCKENYRPITAFLVTFFFFSIIGVVVS